MKRIILFLLLIASSSFAETEKNENFQGMLFGGIFTYYAVPNRGSTCWKKNPATEDCECPTGFTPKLFSEVRENNGSATTYIYYSYFCFKM